MTVKELIEVLRGAPQDYEAGTGGFEIGAGSAKYIDIDGVANTVTIWNVSKDEHDEYYD